MGKLNSPKYGKYFKEMLGLISMGYSDTQVAELVISKHNLSHSSERQLRHFSKQLRKGTSIEEAGTTTDTNDYTQDNYKLSAFDKEGKLMDIDEYCNAYGLPKKDISSYKLVAHTGTPFYNIAFRETSLHEKDITLDIVDKVVNKLVKKCKVKDYTPKNPDVFDRLIYTDTHIGMEPNESNLSLYGGKWDEEEVLDTLGKMVEFTLKHKQGDVLYIDDLGDLMDGYNAQTVRGGHSLPQNMDNEKAFEVALEFKVRMIDMLVDHYKEINCNNICDDNHAGSFAYLVNYAFKKLCQERYPERVIINNHRRFISYYIVGKHAFVITHGKDGKNLKFGFKPILDAKQIEKIDQYLKDYGVYDQAEFIEFSKGDSHQMVFDYTTSADFDYFSFPALSPSSNWVQTNFKKGTRGFVLQNVEYNENIKSPTPYFFKHKRK